MTTRMFVALACYAALAACTVYQFVYAWRRSRATEHDAPGRTPWLRYLLLGVMPAVIVGFRCYDFFWGDRYRVARWLNIPEPPRSLWVLDCESAPVMTDVLSDCLVSVAPRDFDALLAGRTFERRPGHGSPVVLSSGDRNFAATDEFVAWPTEFAHGGAVTVYTNAERNAAIIDLYVE